MLDLNEPRATSHEPRATSHYERLPIYKITMDLVVRLDTVVRGFSRYHKYSIGASLREKSLVLIDLIVQANARETREQKLIELCRHIESIKLLCNIGKEINAWKSFKQFMQVMEQVMNIARQAEGWRKSLQSKRPDPPTSHQEMCL